MSSLGPPPWHTLRHSRHSMTDDPPVNGTFAKLPRALVERLTRPFSRFVQIETAAGAVLLTATLVALLLANSPWADAFHAIWEFRIGVQMGSVEAVRSLKEWINDGLMTLFFFLVALELKREIVLGELGQPRVAALSIAAAAGGMLVPAAIYLLLQSGQAGAAGWGTVMATDTAFVIGCLALLGRAFRPASASLCCHWPSLMTLARFSSWPSAIAATSHGRLLRSASARVFSCAAWRPSAFAACRCTLLPARWCGSRLTPRASTRPSPASCSGCSHRLGVG